jgi:hypothetical protein
MKTILLASLLLGAEPLPVAAAAGAGILRI